MIPPLPRRLALALLLCLALVAGASALPGYPYSQTVEYAACDQAIYQQDVVIHRSAGSAYEETVGGLNVWHLYVGTNCQADYDDLRFTDATGTELFYYLWPDFDAASARFAVRLEGATTAGTLTAHYGNAAATTTSDGDAPYLFFDHFKGTSLDTTKWYQVGSPTVSDSNVTVNSKNEEIKSKQSFGAGTILEGRGSLWNANYHIFGLGVHPNSPFIIYQYGHPASGNYNARSSSSTALGSGWTGVHTWAIHRVTSGSAKYYIDGSLVATVTALAGDMPILLQQHDTYTGSSVFDYILVRAYSAAPPTATAFLSGPAPEAPPVAAFTASPTSGMAPLAVQFADASTDDPTSWHWDFGDGGTSAQQHPSHTYAAAGTYTVTLTATNEHGSDDELKTDYITVYGPAPPTTAFTATPAAGLAPLTVQFTDASTGSPTAWAWTFGDGATSTLQSPSHTYTEPGTYEVTLTATNDLGSDGETKTITVTAPPPESPVVVWGATAYPQSHVPAGLTATAVAAGDYHSLAVKGDGTVVAWGENYAGQCSVPVGLSGVTAVAAGDTYSLALKSDGTVVGWGSDSYGQATPPDGLSGVTAVAAGTYHSLALKSDGTVVGWGRDSDGQATPPDGLTNVVGIAAGTYHSLALKSDGTVVAWGRPLNDWLTPPAGLSGVTAIAARDSTSLALKSDGTVVAWGYNGDGQCNVPADLTGVVGIAVPGRYSLALKDDGTVVHWGYYSTYLIPPSGLVASQIAGGYYHGLALGGFAPVTAFSATPRHGEAPLAVQFTDTSTGSPTSWAWTFGDGATSTLQNPSHTYAELGTYTVTLTATNAYGEDTETKTNYITLETPWAPSFTASPTSGSAPLTVQFTDTSTDDPFDWWWEFGDGDEVFSVQNPSHTYTTPGTYTVILHAVNQHEEVGEVTREGYITVSAAPTPAPPSSSAHSLPYSEQRKDTMGFLLMCWGALAFVGVFCVVIFLLMNGAQRGSGGI